FLENLVIFGVAGIHHFDSLVKTGIERLTLGLNGTQTHFQQGVIQLLVNQFDAVAKFRAVRFSPQGALKAVQAGEQSFYRICNSIFAELLLLALGTLSSVFEFSLQTSQTIDQSVPFGLQL